ncbi:hypothetical protein [Nocardia mangyaensis]|nr:hypothetical protein [Nocardia mangyaensis]
MSSEKPSSPSISTETAAPLNPPGTILATIATGAGAKSVVIDPAGFAYVSNGTDGSVAVLDTNKRVLLTTTNIEAGPIGAGSRYVDTVGVCGERAERRTVGHRHRQSGCSRTPNSTSSH